MSEYDGTKLDRIPLLFNIEFFFWELVMYAGFPLIISK